MKHPHWNYFISLEKDLVDSIPFVELDPTNSKTFSINYAKMLLSACVEIETVLKRLSRKKDSNRKIEHININCLQRYTSADGHNFHEVEVSIPRYSWTQKPWKSWGDNPAKTPTWWSAYNDVKHDPGLHHANQENVVSALAGLFVSLLYFHEDDFTAFQTGESPFLQPMLFFYPGVNDVQILRAKNFHLP